MRESEAKATTLATKLIIINTMGEWCLKGGLATDINNSFGNSENENKKKFNFQEKNGFLTINVIPTKVFPFLSALEEKVGMFDYISFYDNNCIGLINGVWIAVYYKEV